MDWSAVKETSWKWTQRFALFWLLQTSLVYLWACVVAGRPISPLEYVRFQYHVIQWRPARASAAGVSDGAARGSISPSAASVAEVPRFGGHPKITSYIRVNQKAELMNGTEPGALVVAVLEAGTPVWVTRNFSGGWVSLDEIVPDGSHPPAHGYMKQAYLTVPE